MNTLAGRASYGRRTGRVYINEREDSVHHHSARVGFVPQDDVMLRDLTVFENLKYARFGPRARGLSEDASLSETLSNATPDPPAPSPVSRLCEHLDSMTRLFTAISE